MQKPFAIRLMSYNVEFSKNTTPEEVGETLKAYDLDVVTFCEVPAGDWTARVGAVLGMNHVHLGTVSSANHKDKYKSILSRTPLENRQEHCLEGIGWTPASAVNATTSVRGETFSVYSLHVAGSSGKNPMEIKLEYRQSKFLMDQVLAHDSADHIIVAGDFNDRVGEPVMNDYLRAGFTDLWSDLGIDATRGSSLFTCNAFGLRKIEVIDHILHKSSKGRMRVIRGGIEAWIKPLSDHHPVWTEIRVS